MKTMAYLIAIIAVCIYAPFSSANAYEDNDVSRLESLFSVEQNDKAITYQFMGNPEKEGALKLYIKNASNDSNDFDKSADNLNAINPAAGIKLQFEF